MLEYISIHIMINVSNVGELLNSYAKDGWRYVGSVGNVLIMEREKSPSVEESVTENSRILTYSWDYPKSEA